MHKLLEQPRFQKPKNLEFFEHKNLRGQTLRCARSLVASPRGTILILTGLSEFTEKYFETIHKLNAQGLNVLTFDWLSQGGSHRLLLPPPHKTHINSFDEYLSDLQNFIETYLEENKFTILAHSMGGHLSMRYALKYNPQNLNAIFTTAPMLGIYAAEKVPNPFRNQFLKILKKFPRSYVPMGMDYSIKNNPHFSATPVYSSDEERGQLQHLWMHENHALRVGSPTNSWLLAALESCEILKQTLQDKNFPCPVYAFLAGDEIVVSTKTAQKILEGKAQIYMLDGAKHEILVESDIHLNKFWGVFDKEIENLNPHTL